MSNTCRSCSKDRAIQGKCSNCGDCVCYECIKGRIMTLSELSKVPIGESTGVRCWNCAKSVYVTVYLR